MPTGPLDSKDLLDPKDGVTAAIQALFRLEGSRRIHQQLASAAGVSISQQGLRLLGRIVEEGPTSPGQLASMLDLDPAVVTRLLRQLEESGWVSRNRSSEDGRVTVVEVTGPGAETFDRMREVIWRHMRRALSEWPVEDVERLSSLLGRLVEDVQQRPYPSLTEPVSSP
ncbi:MAG TPA: MarR family transcriptional regulator [Acidimicrobiales bacterium]|nr:MarR family transcriptional regulator [Acidimicrobiales bacterium]